MNQQKNPAWWTAANETAWDRTKAAFKRDWIFVLVHNFFGCYFGEDTMG